MTLAGFAAFLKASHLEPLTDVYARVLAGLDVPLMRLFTHLPADELRQLTAVGLQKFLGDLETGEALAVAAESLRQWEADELPGLSKESIQPSDLVLVYAAQKEAMLGFLPLYTDSVSAAVGIVQELETFFRQVQEGAFKVYADIRGEAVEREAKLRVSQEFAEELQASNEELTAVNEELVAQSEELEAQREELQTLYEQLRGRNENVEAEVLKRTGELAERERQLVAAERMANIGSWEFDFATQRVRWSDHNFRIHGYEPQAFEVTYEIVQRHAHPEDAAVMRAHVERAIATGEPYELDFRIIRPDGAVVIARGRAEVIKDAEGKPLKLAGVSMDVTDRRQAEAVLARQAADLAEANQRLLAADQYKNEFLGVISHELRTPLNFITGFASVLLDGVGGEPTPVQAEYLGKVLAGADRLLLLVNDLLDFAAMRAGTLAIRRMPAHLGEVVAEAVTLVEPRAIQKGIALTTELNFSAAANVDAGRIQQVLVNLVDNSVKFTPSGGQVWVRGWNEGKSVVLEVADTGPGIPEDQIPRVFQHFTQLDMGSTRQAGGVGLGLAIVRRLVEAHEGTVEVQSAPDQGTTFRVTLPMEGTGRLTLVGAEHLDIS